MSYRELAQATRMLEQYTEAKATAETAKQNSERTIDFENGRIVNVTLRVKELITELGLSGTDQTRSET